MRRAGVLGAALALALACAPAARAGGQSPKVLPSGLQATLHEVIWPAAGAAKGDRILRLRFVAPRLSSSGASGVGIDVAEGDMQVLCDRVALPVLGADGRAVDEIVISLMARPVPFGATAPDVVQFFDGYRPAGDRCEWEGL